MKMSVFSLIVIVLGSLTVAQSIEGALITAENNVPSEFDTGCGLKVVVNGRSGDWNGDVTFLAGDQEMLLIGLHPERRNLAVRNDVFKRGLLQWTYQWVDATYPEADEEGKREYTFEFTPTGFVLKCGDTILITIPYDELTDDKEQFLSSINLVRFKLSTDAGPINLQYALICPATKLPIASAEQKGTSERYPMAAERAIDGNTSGRVSDNSCANSREWWKAHLHSVSSVSEVIIYSRTDSCCANRIDGTEVYAKEGSKPSKKCGDVIYVPGTNRYVIKCDETLADTIIIQSDNELNLCEVEIYGAISEDTSAEDIKKLQKELDDVNAELDEIKTKSGEDKAEIARLKEQLTKSQCPGQGIWSVPEKLHGKKISKGMLKKWKKAGEEDNIRYLGPWKSARLVKRLVRFIECFETTSETN